MMRASAILAFIAFTLTAASAQEVRGPRPVPVVQVPSASAEPGDPRGSAGPNALLDNGMKAPPP